MDENINRIAALANHLAYNADATKKYIDGAPHIKHAFLRKLYDTLTCQIFDIAKQHTNTPRVLDLGAGEGSSTQQFLKLGAKVVAIDISSKQLEELQNRCKPFSDMLDIRCEDITDTLKNKNELFDIIIANSLLHHIPDYMRMIRESITILSPYGQFFSFQDPLRYDTIGISAMLFSKLAYFSWRIFKGDVLSGFRRWLRRGRGIFLEESQGDNTEFHVIRNGVDQYSINRLFTEHGFSCDITPYFSTQSRFFQTLGTGLGIKNTFFVIAQKRG